MQARARQGLRIKREGVQAIDRVAVLVSHVVARRGARLSELSRATGLPTSTVHRLLHSLEEHGLVDRHADGRYLPGLRLFEWGHTAVTARRLREMARPYLRRVAEETGFPAVVGLLDRTGILIVEWIPGRKFLRREGTGERYPLHLTALGWAILAAWPTDRAEGYLQSMLGGSVPAGIPGDLEGCRALLSSIQRAHYAVLDSLRYPGCRSLGVSVQGSDGAVVGALGAGGPAPRLSDEDVPALGARLAECAAEVSALLGYMAPLPDDVFTS